MDYISQLIENAKLAQIANPVREFEMTNISQLDGITHAIYVIEEIGGNAKKTFDDLKQYKQTKERACPKLNMPASVLYVGSTTTGLKKRIVQHIGDGPKGTYALHIKHWFRGRYKIKILEYDVSNDVLQIIEDALSDKMRPAFGKSGANNK